MNQEQEHFGCIKKLFGVAVFATAVIWGGGALSHNVLDSTSLSGGQLNCDFDNGNSYVRTTQCQQHPEYTTAVECREGGLRDTAGQNAKLCCVKDFSVTRFATGLVYDPERGIGVPTNGDEFENVYECYVEALQDENEFTYIGGLNSCMKQLLSKVKGVRSLSDNSALIYSSKEKR